MAYCSNCGQQLSDGANFCSNCGTRVKPVANNSSQRQTVYEGQLHKCPQCGDVVKSFEICCPTCGYEFRGATASSNVRELSYKLEQIENYREPQKKPTSLVGLLYGSDGRLTRTDEQKINLIRNFSIPNTKEDIYEFMILASSNIDLKLYGMGAVGDVATATAAQRAVSDAWIAKFEQAYEKARIGFGDSSDFMNIQTIYNNKQKQLRLKKLEVPLIFSVLFGIMFLLIITLIVGFAFFV